MSQSASLADFPAVQQELNPIHKRLKDRVNLVFLAAEDGCEGTPQDQRMPWISPLWSAVRVDDLPLSIRRLALEAGGKLGV